MKDDHKAIELIVASKNNGKISEIKALLNELPISVLSLNDFPDIIDVEETGNTFKENAEIKAVSIFNRINKPVIADDSGLEIDALNGKPGVYSSRFAGENANDSDKCMKILELMHDIPDDKRSARFKTAICLIDSDGNIAFTEGICEGMITRKPVGENGFCYDPIFYLPDINKTMAQLLPYEKNKISHRGKALKSALPIIMTLIDLN